MAIISGQIACRVGPEVEGARWLTVSSGRLGLCRYPLFIMARSETLFSSSTMRITEPPSGELTNFSCM